MCRFQELYCSEGGYVIHCQQCNHYQILFNRTILSVCEEDYQKFLTTILHFMQDEATSSLKEIVLPTPQPGVYMLLSKEQLTQFHLMMDTADNEQHALAMMQLFHT